MGYSVWLEFEEYADPDKSTDDYCNVIVTHDDGRSEGFNVWTIEFFRGEHQNMLAEVEESVQEFGYSRNFPDIIVRTLTREHIEEVLKNIIR